MHSLASKSAHVPFRDSKLTQLLQDSLSGQAKTMMFMHVAPEVRCCHCCSVERAWQVCVQSADWWRGQGLQGVGRTPALACTLCPHHPPRSPLLPHPRPQMSSVQETLSTLNFGRNVTEITLGAAKKNAESGAAWEAKERALKSEREAAGARTGRQLCGAAASHCRDACPALATCLAEPHGLHHCLPPPPPMQPPSVRWQRSSKRPRGCRQSWRR